jgi:hypothetical protein
MLPGFSLLRIRSATAAACSPIARVCVKGPPMIPRPNW